MIRSAVYGALTALMLPRQRAPDGFSALIWR